MLTRPVTFTTAPCRAVKAVAVVPVIPSARLCNHNLCSASAVAAVAPAADPSEGEQQPSSEQQQQQQQQDAPLQHTARSKYTKERAKRLAQSWEDENTPNTGIIRITEWSSVGGAATCVAADLTSQRLTRIVPAAGDQTQRAIWTLQQACTRLNQHLEKTSQEEGGRQHKKRALVFQPMMITGDLVTDVLPEGTTVMYTSTMKADAQPLQAALAKRAEAAPQAVRQQDGTTDRTWRQSEGPQLAELGSKSSVECLVSILSNTLSKEGWAELVCKGNDKTLLPVAMQVLQKVRQVRNMRHRDDVAVFVLGDVDVLGEHARSLPALQETFREPTSLLLVRCVKNVPTKLLPDGQSDQA